MEVGSSSFHQTADQAASKTSTTSVPGPHRKCLPLTEAQLVQRWRPAHRQPACPATHMQTEERAAGAACRSMHRSTIAAALTQQLLDHAMELLIVQAPSTSTHTATSQSSRLGTLLAPPLGTARSLGAAALLLSLPTCTCAASRFSTRAAQQQPQACGSIPHSSAASQQPQAAARTCRTRPSGAHLCSCHRLLR